MLPAMSRAAAAPSALIVLAAALLASPGVHAANGARELPNVPPVLEGVPRPADPADQAIALRADGVYLQRQARAVSLAADLEGIPRREVGVTGAEITRRVTEMRAARSALVSSLTLSPTGQYQLGEVGKAEGRTWEALQALQRALQDPASAHGRIHQCARDVERAIVRLTDEQDVLLHAAGFTH